MYLSESDSSEFKMSFEQILSPIEEKIWLGIESAITQFNVEEEENDY